MGQQPDTMAGAGRARKLRARWIVTAELELLSAAHFGGEGNGTADLCLLRDRLEGKALLTGASLGGALRSYLADREGGYAGREPDAVTELFGGGRGDEEGDQSPLFVFDSFGELPQGTATEIRDGVALEGATGTAEDHKKFDAEVLPAGTRFPIRLDLVVSQDHSEHMLLESLARSVEGLAEGEIRLGARGSRGWGACQASQWRAVRFDLSTADGWRAWLTTDAREPLDGVGQAAAREALETAWVDGRLQKSPRDERRRAVADLELRFTGGVLVRSAGDDPAGPDAVHLSSGGVTVLPGTSLAGALRARALRIARFVRRQQDDGDRWVERLFGSVRKDEDGWKKETKLRAARLRISEQALKGGEAMRVSRVRIDRFTGGAFSGALFDEEPVYRSGCTVRLELRGPKRGEIGLVALALKDLLRGSLSVGGTVSAGRGVVVGSGTLRGPDGEVIPLVIGEGAGDKLERLNQWIADFREAEPVLEEATK